MSSKAHFESSDGSTTVSVVVVTFRRPQLLVACLKSVRDSLAKLGRTTEIIVVDNGSNDETAEIVRSEFPETYLLVIDDNVGFTPAVRRGIRRARGEWVALLNDDVVLEAGAIQAMLLAGRDADDIGSVAAQMRFSRRPGTINSAGVEVDRLGVAADRLLGAPIERSERELTEVFGASGGAALYRKAMLEQLGGFDESFFAYLEDVDLAWRARMGGWRAVYEPTAVAYHHHSATLIHGSARKYFLVGRNRVRLLAKNATTRQLARYWAAMIAYDAAYVLYVAIHGRTLAPLRGRLQGLREWRRYRRAGAQQRKAVELAPILGIGHALQRNRAWIPPRKGANV